MNKPLLRLASLIAAANTMPFLARRCRYRFLVNTVDDRSGAKEPVRAGPFGVPSGLYRGRFAATLSGREEQGGKGD